MDQPRVVLDSGPVSGGLRAFILVEYDMLLRAGRKQIGLPPRPRVSALPGGLGVFVRPRASSLLPASAGAIGLLAIALYY